LAPSAVLSLTLCEPPALQLVRDLADAQRMARQAEAHLQRTYDGDTDWLRGFLALFGRSIALPDSLPPPLLQGIHAVRAVRRRPWEGEVPVAQLASASFPKLVISGDHSPVFEAICDTLAVSLGAERAHVAGAGHATAEAGEQTLEKFIYSTAPKDGRTGT
jgi:hypothetical protein